LVPGPESKGRAAAIRNRQILKVEGAGHWVHHDRLDLFLEESKRFLLQGRRFAKPNRFPVLQYE
jgi:pimeloyl-ACP methyl ester carboxylesterase